jgi:hypothetical protein
MTQMYYGVWRRLCALRSRAAGRFLARPILLVSAKGEIALPFSLLNQSLVIIAAAASLILIRLDRPHLIFPD